MNSIYNDMKVTKGKNKNTFWYCADVVVVWCCADSVKCNICLRNKISTKVFLNKPLWNNFSVWCDKKCRCFQPMIWDWAASCRSPWMFHGNLITTLEMRPLRLAFNDTAHSFYPFHDWFAVDLPVSILKAEYLHHFNMSLDVWRQSRFLTGNSHLPSSVLVMFVLLCLTFQICCTRLFVKPKWNRKLFILFEPTVHGLLPNLVFSQKCWKS